MLDSLSLPSTIRGSLAFEGRNDSSTSAEPCPSFEPTPCESPCRRWKAVVGGRIDGVSALCERLGLSVDDVPTGEVLFLAAFARWDLDVAKQVLGAWVAALWDDERRRLYLLRDGIGEAVLHWRRVGPVFHFDESLPRLLCDHGPRPAIQLSRLADLLLLNFRGHGEHVFEGMGRVGPGEVLSVSPSGKMKRHQAYEPLEAAARRPPPRTEDEAVEAMTEALRKAVLRRVPSEGPVGFHLSSGLDSGSILGVLQGEPSLAGRLHAYAMTAPPQGRSACPPNRVFDELPVVRELVGRCPGVSLHPIPYGHEVYPERIRAFRPFLGSPNMMSFNHAWYEAISAQAAEDGVSVVLAGFAGNFSYSHSPFLLGPLQELRVRKLEPEWGVKLALKGVLRGLWNRFQIFSGRRFQMNWRNLSMISEAFAIASGALKRREEEAEAPPALKALQRGQGAWRRSRQILGMSFLPEYLAGFEAQFGVATIDPFRDRQLVELSLALRDDHCLAGGHRRGMALEVWKHLYPGDVTPYAGPRGYQTANWVERMDRSLEGMQRELPRWKAHAIIEEIIDLPAVEAALQDWSSGDVDPVSTFSRYYHALARAVSVADFILRWEEEGGRVS